MATLLQGSLPTTGWPGVSLSSGWLLLPSRLLMALGRLDLIVRLDQASCRAYHGGGLLCLSELARDQAPLSL